MKISSKLWLGVLLLALLSPLGIIIPKYFQAGSAWGEWGREELRGLAGYLPVGLGRLAEIWKAPFAGYGFSFGRQSGPLPLTIGYVICGLAGAVVAALAALLIAKKLINKDEKK